MLFGAVVMGALRVNNMKYGLNVNLYKHLLIATLALYSFEINLLLNP